MLDAVEEGKTQKVRKLLINKKNLMNSSHLYMMTFLLLLLLFLFLSLLKS